VVGAGLVVVVVGAGFVVVVVGAGFVVVVVGGGFVVVVVGDGLFTVEVVVKAVVAGVAASAFTRYQVPALKAKPSPLC
jgi:hypothetical protein